MQEMLEGKNQQAWSLGLGAITQQKHRKCGGVPWTKDEILIIKPQLQIQHHRGWLSPCCGFETKLSGSLARPVNA